MLENQRYKYRINVFTENAIQRSYSNIINISKIWLCFPISSHDVSWFKFYFVLLRLFQKRLQRSLFRAVNSFLLKKPRLQLPCHEIPSTIDDVCRLICSTTFKSCPLDPIPTFLVKKFAGILCAPIANVVNLSVNLFLPRCFKTSLCDCPS